jgi:signal transduction histidine kinase
VFVNLLLNAVDAMEEVGGTLTVSTRQLEDGMVEVQVMDSGKGIPEEHIDKIFTPFFTTKWPKKGTGLGLPISKRIIKNHQGMITVESQVGKGTCFTIRLPSGSGAAEGEQ